MPEIDLTVTVPVPRPPSPVASQLPGGLSWNPVAQQTLLQLRGPYVITATAKLVYPLLDLNPGRVMFTVQLLNDNSQFVLRPGTNSDDIPFLFGPALTTSGLPVRVHTAEWPVLCSGEWTIYFQNIGDTVEVWEIVANN